MGEDFWRGQDGGGAGESRRRGANNGRSTEEITEEPVPKKMR